MCSRKLKTSSRSERQREREREREREKRKEIHKPTSQRRMVFFGGRVAGS
jgi:hypothetical protein